MEQLYFYRFKDKINIWHQMAQGNEHPHTLDVIAYFSCTDGDYLPFSEMEKRIYDFFKLYEGTLANDWPIMEGMDVSIENIGYAFYRALKPLFADTGYELVELGISEKPSRIYLVTDFLIDGELPPEKMVAERKLANYIKNNYEKTLAEYIAYNQTKKEEPLVVDEIEEPIEEIEESKPELSIEMDAVEKTKKQSYIAFGGLVAASVVIAAAFMGIVNWFHLFINSGEVYLHLGKGQYLLSQLISGSLAPMYMESWYDGYLMFMHCEPLTYYLLALCGFFMGGDVAWGYAIALAVIALIGMIGFCQLGKVMNRPVMGWIMGLLWFVMPEISRQYLITGNVKALLAMSLIPLLTAFLVEYLSEKGRIVPIRIAIVMWLIVLSDLSIALITFFGMICLFAGKAFLAKQGKRYAISIVSMLVGFGLSAGWLYSAFRNGSLPDFFMDPTGFQIDIPVLALLLICTIFSYKVLSYYGVIGLIAGVISIYFFNSAGAVMYMALFLLLLEWKKCKKKFLYGIFLVVIISNVFSLQRNIENGHTNQYLSESGLDKAVMNAAEYTDDTLLYIDVDHETSYPAYYMVDQGKKVVFSNPSSAKYNMISDNMDMIKYAMYSKRYSFVFDRSMEMGCDTILMNLHGLILSADDTESVKNSGETFGYELVDGSVTDQYLVFHKEQYAHVGNLVEYKGLAIGESAKNLALIYPYFEVGASNDLSDYTTEKLKKYDKIYLSGFRYHDREIAEKMIRELADTGVEIYVDMDTIPADPLTNRPKFFGVTAQTIVFEEYFPKFYFGTGSIAPRPFEEKNLKWNTVYLENLDEITGYTYVGDKKLPYYGTINDGKIRFMGFNMVYYGIESGDSGIQYTLDQIFGLQKDEAPVRIAVPVSVTYTQKQIQIKSDADQVVLPVAYQGTFESDSKIREVNHMLTVPGGRTIIGFNYDNFYVGVLISVVILIGVGAVNLIYILKGRKRYV